MNGVKMKNNKNMQGHILALFTMVVWGTTIISSKVLLRELTPAEIIFMRFGVAFLLLNFLYLPRMKFAGFKKEVVFAAAGLFGVTLYFNLENHALTYIDSSNVSIILSTAPFFTAMISAFILKKEKLQARFFIGLFTAMLGIAMISLNSFSDIKFSPAGDGMCIGAALVWGSYSVITEKISSWKVNVIQMTRRIFFYGLIFMIPELIFGDFSFRSYACLAQPKYLLNILYLGLIASAACFVTWNSATKLLGASKAANYIYAVPAITLITSRITIGEKITAVKILGIILTTLGLIISVKHTNKQNMPLGAESDSAQNN